MRRQPDFATTPRPRRGIPWDGAAVAVAAFILAVAAVSALRARSDARAARARAEEVRRDVVAASSRVRDLEARARRGRRGLSPAEAPPVHIVATIATALPAAARLERLSIDYLQDGAVEMHVVARDAAAWDLLLERLEEQGRLKEVQPGPEVRDAEVRSVIRARWAGGVP